MTKKSPHRRRNLGAAGLCMLALLVVPQVADAQVGVGVIDGGDDEVGLGTKVLMVNGEGFAFAEDQNGNARFLRWTLGNDMFEPDPGTLGAADFEVMVGRYQGNAIMAVGGNVAMYSNPSNTTWNPVVVSTLHLQSTPLAPMVAMVRRSTFDAAPAPLLFAAQEHYVANPVMQNVTLGTGLNPLVLDVLDSPELIRTTDCLYIPTVTEVFCAGSGAGDLQVVFSEPGASITQIDASESYLAVLDAGSARLFEHREAPTLIGPVAEANDIVLTQDRFVVATANNVQIFLRKDREWCFETTIYTADVASMDLSEDQETLLLGIPGRARLEAFSLNRVRDAICSTPPGDAGPGSDAGPRFDAGPGTDAGQSDNDGGSADLVERSELSCTCRVGETAPSPFALISGALVLGALVRRRLGGSR